MDRISPPGKAAGEAADVRLFGRAAVRARNPSAVAFDLCPLGKTTTVSRVSLNPSRTNEYPFFFFQ